MTTSYRNLTYVKCQEILENRAWKKIANNTRLLKEGNDFHVVLHETSILVFRKDGSIVINMGGWATNTTKKRINRFGPVRVYQHKGVLYVGNEKYYKGMIISGDELETSLVRAVAEGDEAAKLALKDYRMEKGM